MKKTTTLSFILCLGLFSRGLLAQDIHFSQIFETPLLRNPALAGLFAGDVRIQSVHRNQWSSISLPYRTTSLSGEYKLQVSNQNDFITLGTQIMYDQAGSTALSATHVLPAINYHKSLSDDRNQYLSIGFMAGYVQRSVNQSKMTTNNQFDGTGFNGSLSNGENLSGSRYGYFDGSAGISLNSQISENPNDNIYLGLAYHHFNRPGKASFYSDATVEIKPKWVASGGVRMKLTDYTFFTLETEYSKQDENMELISGSLFSYKLDDPDNAKYILNFGSYFRWKDAIIPVARLDCKPLSFGLSYDINISSLRQATRGRGGFEASISYQKFLKEKTGQEFFRCPNFW
jgi:type IX secretion system PorP/SprF family membrane protein